MTSKKKKLKLQFYADECFPLPSVIFLKSLGYSIRHAYELKMVQKSDKTHFDKCKLLDRVLLTVDQRLKRYENFNYENHPGVIVIKCSSTVPSNVNKHAAFVLKKITSNVVKESIINGSLDRITQRKNEKVVSIYEKAGASS